MANETLKPMSDMSGDNVLRNAHNQVDGTISTSGFITAFVGRKVTLAISTTTVANDTETYAFSESGIALYTLKIIYTTGTRDVMLSAERTV